MNHGFANSLLIKPRFALHAALSLVMSFPIFGVMASDDLEIAIIEAFSGETKKAEAPAGKAQVDRKLILPDINPVACSSSQKTSASTGDVVTLKELADKLKAEKLKAERPEPRRRVAEVMAAPRSRVARASAPVRTEARARRSSSVVSPLPSYSRAMIAKKNPPRCRIHPISGQRKTHAGCDMGARTGTTIVSVLDGTVVDSGSRGGYGNMVTVRHRLPNGQVVFSKYAHMSTKGRGCKMPRKGTKVSAGEKIGCVGNTGYSKGPHLHFEIRSKPNGGTIYDSKHFVLNNGALKHAGTCSSKRTSRNSHSRSRRR